MSRTQSKRWVQIYYPVSRHGPQNDLGAKIQISSAMRDPFESRLFIGRHGARHFLKYLILRSNGGWRFGIFWDLYSLEIFSPAALPPPLDAHSQKSEHTHPTQISRIHPTNAPATTYEQRQQSPQRKRNASCGSRALAPFRARLHQGSAGHRRAPRRCRDRSMRRPWQQQQLA